MSLTEDNVLPTEPYKQGHFLSIECHWLDEDGVYDEEAAVARVNKANSVLYKEPGYKANAARAKITAILEQRALDKELAEYL